MSDPDFERLISTTTKVTQWSFYIPFTANDSADSGLCSDSNNWNGIQPVLTASESFFLSMPWTVWMQPSHGQQLAALPHNPGLSLARYSRLLQEKVHVNTKWQSTWLWEVPQLHSQQKEGPNSTSSVTVFTSMELAAVLKGHSTSSCRSSNQHTE